MKESISRRKHFRRLIGESLESRQLMASDMIQHNFMMPEDSDMNGRVTPLDALVIINQLNLSGETNSTEGETGETTFAMDVNADGALSPLDALTVINFVNQSIGRDEILVSQVSVQARIERLDEAVDADLLPPNVDLVMATQVREILRAGGFPEIGDRLVDGVLSRGLGSPASTVISDSAIVEDRQLNDGESNLSTDNSSGPVIDLSFLNDIATINGSDDNPSGGGSTGVNDPTNDNGNGSFLDAESAKSIVDFIEIELRKQLKVNDDASIRVAVFNNPGKVISGTWFYLTEEGIGASGNWSYVADEPETLNLFRSNVDVEKRIYVQYPGSGFIYYSWLPEGPVGYYFSPIDNSSAFKDYFDNLSGSNMSSIAGFVSFSGDLGVFEGIAAIEQQALTLFSIDLASRNN